MNAPVSHVELAPPAGDVRLARWLALLLPASLLAGAYASEYFGGLVPCEMCWWQRYAHFAAVALAAPAFALPAWSRPARALIWLAAAAAIALSGLIGLFHAGVEQRWWQGLTACTAGGARSLDDILATPLVRCDQIPFQFLGLSMAGWNALLSLGGAAAILWLSLRRPG